MNYEITNKRLYKLIENIVNNQDLSYVKSVGVNGYDVDEDNKIGVLITINYDSDVVDLGTLKFISILRENSSKIKQSIDYLRIALSEKLLIKYERSFDYDDILDRPIKYNYSSVCLQLESAANFFIKWGDNIFTEKIYSDGSKCKTKQAEWKVKQIELEYTHKSKIIMKAHATPFFGGDCAIAFDSELLTYNNKEYKYFTSYIIDIPSKVIKNIITYRDLQNFYKTTYFDLIKTTLDQDLESSLYYRSWVGY